jgi:hypothetical protein
VGHSAATPNLFNAFSSLILVTTYLATAMALMDVLRGALRGRSWFRSPRKIDWQKKAVLAGLCFTPPLVIGIALPGAFVQLLSFASIFTAGLSILFPVAALHRLRSEGARRAGLSPPGYRVFVFWGMYVLVFECGALIVAFQVLTMLGALKS